MNQEDQSPEPSPPAPIVSPDGRFYLVDGQWVPVPGPPAVHPAQRHTFTRPHPVLAIGAILLLIFVVLVVQSAIRQATSVTVIYHVTGSTSVADITYRNSLGELSTQTGLSVPIQSSQTGKDGLTITTHSGEVVQIDATNARDSGSIECDIEVNGQILTANRSVGGHTSASCTATVP